MSSNDPIQRPKRKLPADSVQPSGSGSLTASQTEKRTSFGLSSNDVVRPSVPTMPRSVDASAAGDSASKQTTEVRRVDEMEYTKLKTPDRGEIIVHQLSNRAILARHYFELHQMLGRGHYASVYRVQIVGQFGKYACKIVDDRLVREHYKKKFLPRELKIWPSLSHPNITCLSRCFFCDHRYFFVMEYAAGGDMLSFIKRIGITMPEADACCYFRQIVSAVYYLHMRQIAHRDLKLENILMTGDYRTLKLTDFGFARTCSVQDRPSRSFCGSKAYSCPEILKTASYNPFKADTWSCGVIAFILATGTMPFKEDGASSLQIVEAQLARNYVYQPSLQLSEECVRTVDSMLTFFEAVRPTIVEICEMAWLRKFVEHTNVDVDGLLARSRAALEDGREFEGFDQTFSDE